MARILICDQDSEARGALAGVMVELGHQVLQAETGDQAIEAVQTQQPTVLFIEPELEQRDGVDVLKALRQRGYELPVFFVAAKLKSSLVAEAMQHGLRDFMLKPVDPAQLEKKLNEALEDLPESVQEHAAAVHQPTRRWLVVSASERISQALVTEIGDDISLQQVEDLDELAGLNDDRLVECVVVDAPRGAKLDILVAGLKENLPDASLIAVYPHRTPLPAARAWEQGFHLGVTPPFTAPKVGSFVDAKNVETSVLVGDTLVQPHPPAEGDGDLDDYLTSVQSTLLSAVESLGAACAEYCILDLRWLPHRHASQSMVVEAARQAMQYGVDVVAVGGTDVQNYFEAAEVTRWVEDLSEWLT
jgi:CheY-like chemotaxis protein